MSKLKNRLIATTLPVLSDGGPKLLPDGRGLAGAEPARYLSAAVHCLHLIFVQIFAWNIVFRYLVRANFLLVRIPSAFHARYNVRLERIPFLE